MPDTLCYLSEQTSCADDYNNFGYTVHDKGSRFYLTFEGVLQSFGVKNRNKREYEASNIMDCINKDPYIQDQLKRNHWMGEMDHPAPRIKGEELTISRISTPNLGNSSHYIRSPKLEGNLLVSNIQTDSGTEAGRNMAIKIVDGKIIPGFSARSLGDLRNINGRPVVFVKKLITYDWVGFNSHPEALARITQPLQESVDAVEDHIDSKIIFLTELAHMAANNSKETEWLCESFDLSINDVIGMTSDGSSVVIQENANIYVQPISDKFIRQKTQNTMRDWLNK